MKQLKVLAPKAQRVQTSDVTCYTVFDDLSEQVRDLYRQGYRPVGEALGAAGYFLLLDTTDYDRKMRRYKYLRSLLDEKCSKSGIATPASKTINFTYDGYWGRVCGIVPPTTVEMYVF